MNQNQNSGTNNSGPGLFETLSEDKQMHVLNLVSITNIDDLDLAVLYLEDSGYDINRATQAYFDKKIPGQNRTNSNQSQTRGSQASDNNARNEERKADPRTELMKSYEEHLKKKKREEDENGGLIKSITGGVSSGAKGLWSFVPLSIRGENCGAEEFYRVFSKNYPEIMKTLEFNYDKFDKSAEHANKQNRPLLVYIHSEGSNFAQLPKVILLNPQINGFLKSKKFVLLGLLSYKNGFQEISKYIKPQDCPCIAMFRTNLMDEIVMLDRMTLTKDTNPTEVLDKIKNAEGTFYTLMAEEEKIKSDSKKKSSQRRNLGQQSMFSAENQQFLFDPYFFGYNEFQQQPPRSRQQQQQRSPEDQMRLEEARLLRQQQEEDFKEVERQIKMQQDVEKEKNMQLEKERMGRQQEAELKKIMEESIRMEKERAKNEIKQRLQQEPAQDDPNATLLVFRLPDGNRISRRFTREDKISLLYDFIDSSDIKFEGNGDYDLIQPMPFLALNDKEKTLREYFEDSPQETVVLREPM